VTTHPPTNAPVGSPRRFAVAVVCTLLAGGATLWIRSTTDISPAAGRALFILLLAAALWATEAIAAFAVGILVIGLKIALLGRPGGVFAVGQTDWEQFVYVMGSPLVWLFFGGFVLAAGMSRTGLDRRLAAALLERVGGRPGTLLAGVLGTTFVLSMFMSNTATAAMMLAVLTPVLAALGRDDRFAVGLLMAIVVGGNLGGMGSLIGTPPNAIAVGALTQTATPVEISFLQWLALGLPPAVLLAAMAWWILLRRYPAGADTMAQIRQVLADSRAAANDIAANDTATNATDPSDTSPAAPAGDSTRFDRWIVIVTLSATVALWLTQQWHGIPTAAVSLLPIVVLTATGVLGPHEIRGLPYDVLFLLGGGLALGQMVIETGLGTWIVAHLPIAALGPAALALAITYLTVLLSNFMSNTAAANILVPLGVAMAAGHQPLVASSIALGASSAMCLPIATPPGALVYATERVTAKDFLSVGTLIALAAPPLALLWLTVSLEVVLS